MLLYFRFDTSVTKTNNALFAYAAAFSYHSADCNHYHKSVL